VRGLLQCEAASRLVGELPDVDRARLREREFKQNYGEPPAPRSKHARCRNGDRPRDEPLLAAVRWLHDALIEDALDRAETATAGRPVPARRWSPWVRLLRAALT
jgi:hypothetical protein